MTKGKFIVIEGTDGSGKGTQVELLVNRIRKSGLPLETTDFPQYQNPPAFFVEKYLRGEYGTAEEVGPRRGSVFYAVDRYDKSAEIRRWLESGIHVVSNRYVSANMGHQAGKIDDPIARDQFLSWLDDFEFGIMGIPRPDAVIFLFMPPEIGQKLVDNKAAREYTAGKKRDIHEADIKHLTDASNAFVYVAGKYGWETINCAPGGDILTREEVHQEVWGVVNPLFG